MEFKDLLNKISELELNEAKKESTKKEDEKAEKAGKKVAKDIEHDEGHKGKDDNKAEKAGKKVTKDIEYDDKKDKKKKSLKDWFDQFDKEMLAEAEQIEVVPAKQTTSVIKKGGKTLGSVSNPQLAQQIKQSIGKGEMSLAGDEIKEEEMEESGLQAYLGKKKYGEKGMKALQKAGREGASKEKMAKIRAQHDKLDEVQVDEKAKNPYAIGMAQAMKSSGDKPPLKKSTIVKAHDIAKSIKKKTDEAEIASTKSQDTMGAGLGAGRSDKVLEAKPDFLDLDKDGNKKESMKKAAADKKKKKVDESMNTKTKAAYQEGYAHGLRELACRVKHYQDMEEAKSYYEGYKCGLDECYGMKPVQGLVVGETMPAATVPGMASQAMPSTPTMEDDMEEGNLFTGNLAAARAAGKAMADLDGDGDMEKVQKEATYAFEDLEMQLDALLKEEVITEGLSVNMQQGIGAMGDDSVSVTATGDDSAKLLDFIKQVGLGGMGDQAQVTTIAEPAVAVVSDYGAPKFSGHDGMKDLMAKVQGDDYEEEGHGEHGHSEPSHGEKVDEVESEDQMEYEVAEDSAGQDEEEMTTADEKAEAEEDLTKPASGGAVSEGGDGMEDEESVEESACACEDEDKEEKLDEWANNAGQKGTDQAFERDIDFMTKVISGGLNKPKSTGQTTIPVIAGQEARTGDEDVQLWKKLAGIEK